jgi:membrane-bound metal-dependent hydrolase YbcI (DUF457 family)
MFLFGHIGVTLGIFFGLSLLAPRFKTIINPLYLAIGALLPDFIDKPIGRVIFAHTIANGRIIGHTLLFSFLILLLGLYIYDKKREIIVITLATGSFFHLVEDQMWNDPGTLFWPIFGLNFQKGNVDDTGIGYLLRELENSFTLHFSQSAIPEILGMMVIVILTLHWLIKRFWQNKL